MYNIKGMSKEEAVLEASIKALLYRKQGSDAKTAGAWANLNMIERLWFLLREEREEVRGCLPIVICAIN